MLKTNNIFFFDADEFELIITHYLEVGELNLAKKAAKISLSQHPNSTELSLLHVEILLFEDKIVKAETILNDLQHLAPQNPDIFIYKANIASKRDEHEKAVAFLKKAEELVENDEEIYALIAMEYMFLNDYQKAKKYFLKGLEIVPDDYSNLYNLIFCYDHLEQVEEAIDFLNEYINAYPYSEIAWHQLGLQYLKAGNHQKALESFDFAIISDDEFSGAYIEKAKVLEELELYDEAIASYQHILDLEEKSAYLYFHLGLCYEKLGKDKLALEQYNKALQEDPLSEKTWIALCDFFTRKKQFKKALRFIEKALAIDENNEEYWSRLIQISNQMGEKGKIETAIRRSLENNKYEFETWITRCDLLIGLGNFKAALKVIQEAHLLFPNTIEVEYRLAGLHLELNQKEPGLHHLNRALNWDKEYAVVIKELFPNLFDRQEVRELLTQRGWRI